MNITFIVGTLTIGGIETYISRLSKYLSKNTNITILLLSKKNSPELLKSIKNFATIYYLHDYYTNNILKKINISYLSLIAEIDYKELLNDIGKIDYIHAVDSTCSMVGLELSSINRNIKLTIGTYHSKEYTWSSKFYFRNIEKSLFLSLPKENIINANDEINIYYKNIFKQSFERCPIVPTGIDLDLYKNNIPNYKSNKIISVGRLVNFKTYNKHIINMIDDINQQLNSNYEYHIYGDGPEINYLKEIAAKQKSKIIFHGTIQYDLLTKVFLDTYIFVGNGTSVVEASAAGIPSLIGIESEEETFSYGLFSDIRILSFNKKGLNIPIYSLEEEILKILKLNESEYSIISRKSREKALEFSIEETSIKFKHTLKNSKLFMFTYNKFRYKLSLIIWLIFNRISFIKEKSNRYL